MTTTTHNEPNYIAVFWWLTGSDHSRARGYLYADSQASDSDRFSWSWQSPKPHW